MTSFTKLCFTRGYGGQTALSSAAGSDSTSRPQKRPRVRNQRNSRATPVNADSSFEEIKDQQGGVERGAADSSLSGRRRCCTPVAVRSLSFAMLNWLYATRRGESEHAAVTWTAAGSRDKHTQTSEWKLTLKTHQMQMTLDSFLIEKKM